MERRKIVLAKLPRALQLSADFFRANPKFYAMPGLFDATILNLLLSQDKISFTIKYEKAYLLANYFKNYFRCLMKQISHPLIP